MSEGNKPAVITGVATILAAVVTITGGVLLQQKSSDSAKPQPSPIVTPSSFNNSSSSPSPSSQAENKPDQFPSAIPSLSGYVGDVAGKKRLNSFLFNHERQIVKVDINMSEEQMARLEEWEADNKNDPNFGNSLYIDLNYEEDGYPAGSQLIVHLSKNSEDFYFDRRWTSRRIQSYLKIQGVQGPNQGMFSIAVAPVSIESVRK